MDYRVYGHAIEKIREVDVFSTHELDLGSQWWLYV